MAFYQNGLTLVNSTEAVYAGHVLSRWLFEWLTQVVGWTAHDSGDSKWSNVEASGTGATAGSTTADSARVDMSSSGRSWTTADREKYITITGLTTSLRDGVYRIVDVEASDIVLLDIKRGVHSDGLPSGETFNWRLWAGTDSYYPTSPGWAVIRSSYSHTPAEPNFDIKIGTDVNYDYGSPSIGIGPFGTWNNSTHAWTGSRNTAQKEHASNNAANGYNVWAYATDNHAVIAYCPYDSTYIHPNFMYLGEITVPSTTDDPNPGIIVQGNQLTSEADWRLAIGPGSLSGGYRISDGVRWMSKLPANDTEVSCFMQIPGILCNDGTALLDTPRRRLSSWSKNVYRIEIALECVTSGHMENRGLLTDVWAGGRWLQNFMPFGSSKEYLHCFGGLSFPWNGSIVHVQR